MAMKKLIVRIKGGLGNQLFCYAAARRLSWFNNAELVLDHVSGFVRDIEYKRKFRLDGFSISARLLTKQEQRKQFERIRRGITKLVNRCIRFEQRSYIEQASPDFDPRLMNLKLKASSTVIDGLWQSAHYFADIEEILRNDLRIKPPKDMQNLAAHAWIKKYQAVSVHVRWFSSPETKLGATNNVQNIYYLNALSIIRDKIKNPYYVVFSDEPKAAALMLNLPREQTLVIDWNSGDGGELADLWLMSSCQHFILANSTFSWWGAWLGALGADQIVLFPRREPTNAIGWAWDFEGQMPSTWVPVHESDLLV
jgi:hypothetical protein